MSLDFRFTDIPDYKSVTRNPDGTLRGVTECIIFSTMAVGIGDTGKHADEFVWRVQFYEKVFGPTFALGPDGPIALPVEELRKHIGLRTNVGHETRASWVKRMTQKSFEETIRSETQDTLPV